MPSHLLRTAHQSTPTTPTVTRHHKSNSSQPSPRPPGEDSCIERRPPPGADGNDDGDDDLGATQPPCPTTFSRRIESFTDEIVVVDMSDDSGNSSVPDDEDPCFSERLSLYQEIGMSEHVDTPRRPHDFGRHRSDLNSHRPHFCGPFVLSPAGSSGSCPRGVQVSKRGADIGAGSRT